MKSKNIILNLFLVVIFSCLSLSKASAQKGAYVADFICEYAKNLYDQGILEEAKHEFSKALIIDPDNTMAKSYLEKMGLETGRYQVERPDLAVSKLAISKQARSISDAPYAAVVFSPHDISKNDELVLLSAQLAGLKQQIFALQEAMAAKDGEVKTKEDETGLLKEKFVLAQDNLNQLRKDAIERDQQLAKLKGQIGALEVSSVKEFELYKMKLETLESSVSKVDEKTRQEEALLKQDSAREFSKELAGLRAQLDILQRGADHKDDALERAKDMLKALEMASVKQIKKYQDALEELENSVAAKTGEVGVKQDSMEALAQELVSSENQLKNLQEQITLKNCQLEEAKEKILSGVEFSEKLSRQHKEELDVLRSSLAGARKELFVKEASLKELEKELALTQEEKSALDNKILQHGEEARSSKGSFVSQGKAIKEQEKSFRELSVLSERLKREVDALSKNVEEKEEYIKKFAGEFDQYKKRLDEEIHAYRNEIKTLGAAISDKDGVVHQKEEFIAKLNKKLLIAQDTLEVFRASKQELVRQKEEVIKKHSEEMAYAQGQLRSLQEEVQAKDSALKQLNGKLEAQIFSSNKDLKGYKEEISSLQASVNLKEEALKELYDKLTRVQQDFDGLRDEIRTKEGRLSILHEEAKTLKADAIRQSKGYEDEVQSLKVSVATKEQELAQKEGLILQLNEKLASTGSELNELQVAASERAAQVQQLKEEITAVKDILGRHFQTYNDQIASLQTSFSAQDGLKNVEEQTRNLAVASGRQLKAYHDKLKKLQLLLADANSDLALKNRAISEKEEEIAGLRNKLSMADAVTSDLRTQALEKDKAIVGLEGRLKNFMGVSGHQFKALRQQQDVLENKLLVSAAALEEKNCQLRSSEAVLEQKNEALRRTTDELAAIKEHLRNSTQELVLRNKQVVELNGRIELLSSGSSEQLISYGAQIKTLEDSIVQKDRLSEIKNHELKQKESFILELTEKLKYIQKDADQLQQRVLLGEARVKELETQVDQQKQSLEKELNIYKGRLSILESSKEKQDKILTEKQKAVEDLLVAKGEMDAMIHLKQEAFEAEKINSAKQANSYKDQLGVVEKFLLLKDQLMQEREGALKDVSDKLSLAMQGAKDKDAEILRQEFQIQELQKKQQYQTVSSQQDFEKYQDQIKTLKESMEIIKDSLSKSQEEVCRKQGLIDEAHKTNILMEEKIGHFQREISDRDSRMEDLAAANVSFKRQMDEYREQMRALESAFAAKKEDFYKQESMMKEIGEQFTLVKERLEKSVAEKDAALKAANLKLRQVSDEAALLKRDVSKTESESKSLASKNEGLRNAQEKKIAQYEERLKSLENSLGVNRQQLKDGQDLLGGKELIVTKLKEQASVSEEKNKQYQDDIASRQKEIEGLKAELKGAQDQAARYEDQFETLEGLLSDKNFQLQTVKTKVDGQATTFGQQLKAYKERIASLEALISAKDKDLHNKSGVVEAKDAAFEAINKDFSSSKAQLIQFRSQMTVKDGTIDKLENDLRNSELLKKEYIQKISYLENLLAAKNKELQGKQGLVETRDNDFSNLTKKLIAAEKELIELKHSLEDKAQKENEATLLKQQLETQDRSSEASKAIVAEYQDQIRVLEKSLQDRNRVVERTENSQKENEGIIKELYIKIESLESELKAYKTSTAEKDAQFKVLKKEIEDLADMSDRERKNYKDKIGSLKTSSVAKEKLAQLSNEIKTLASSSGRQLEMYKEQLGVLESSLSSRDEQLKKQEELLSNQAVTLSQNEEALKESIQKFDQMQDSFKSLKQELAVKDSLIDGYKERIKDLAAAAGRQLKGHKELLNKLSGKNEELESLVEEKDEVMKARVSELNTTMEQLRQSLKSEIKDYQAKLDLAKKGIVVGVLADLLFGSGSADISPEGQKVLSKISDVLKKVPGNNHIVVEGHTDNVPIRYSRWRSNWELSSERALSVLEYLVQESELDPAIFSAQGYGEYRPVEENDTSAGQKQNRRVEIVIQPQLRKVDAQELPAFSSSNF